ncbi:unnamed protein product [Urochloa decumbens]|uniref:NB-ARC domain-containing protein n=1 Tax=Urochloa decumbens TaxID=240449 RepID=A0ABC9BZR8_9POAL
MVDAFLVRIVGHRLTEHSCFKWLMEKMTNLFKKAKARRQIAIGIRDIKTQVLDVATRRDRYRVDSVGANLPAPTSTVDPRLLSLYKDKKEIVGIQEPVDNIIKRLSDRDGKVSRCQLKILSIFGPGGLGKTTLAKAVYDRLQQQFVLRCFVSVGRNPDVKKVLKDILLQLDKEKYVNNSYIATLDERQLIDEVRGLLESMRYLVVIDDIWDVASWEITRCALVDSNHGSKIITTTRIFEVATKASDIHKLEPLSHDNSKELFYRRLLGGNEKCPDDKLPEVSEKLLHKCGGVPLAIITIASLLATKPRHDWPKVYNSIGFGSGENEDVRNTRKILMFSYYDLPSYLKTCLLHLCTFPEDHLIKKRNLIWKWVAEGFVGEESGIGLFEIGERYFNELINRSMIQPVQKPKLGIINGCRVHDMVLDMICSISKEENFVSMQDSHEQHTTSQSKARRLAIQKRYVQQHDPLNSIHMPQIRSFNAISCHFSSMMPPLSNFKGLRVLAMENCTFMGQGSWHLENLGRLLQLRFLGLRGTPIRELPEEIGNLMFLQILDLKYTGITKLPQSVDLLRQLKCLYTVFGVSDCIGNLTSLQELQYCYIIDKPSPNFLKELGKMTQLRVLKIQVALSYMMTDELKFLNRMLKRSNLQNIVFVEPDWEGFIPPRKLIELTLAIGSYRLPAWINSSLIPNLRRLDLGVKTLESQHLQILGMFLELITLRLWSSNTFCFEVMGNGTFPKLMYFCPRTNVILRFLQGAMPSLQSIRLEVRVTDNFDFSSLRNLTCLEEVTVEMNCLGALKSEVEEAKAALRHTIHNHPNSPTLHLETIFGTGFWHGKTRGNTTHR